MRHTCARRKVAGHPLAREGGTPSNAGELPSVRAENRTIGVMTWFADRPHTVVLVVDAQVGVLGAAHRRDEVVAAIERLVARARDGHVRVIWVQHSSDELVEGSDEWALVPELVPLAGETIVHKRYGDAFEDTALDDELARHGVGRVVVAGGHTDACIRATLHGAFVRGYDTVLVADAHTTEDLTEWGMPAPELVIAHANTWWTWQAGPGRVAAVVAAADVELSG
jgi:isochorismate hydrolase